MATVHNTILRPIITEQSSAAYQERGEYTFEVAPGATKHAIKEAIERLFGVTVTGVWTSNMRGKSRRVGAAVGRRPHVKKAIVKLRDGDSIAVFEG